MFIWNWLAIIIGWLVFLYVVLLVIGALASFWLKVKEKVKEAKHE